MPSGWAIRFIGDQTKTKESSLESRNGKRNEGIVTKLKCWPFNFF